MKDSSQMLKEFVLSALENNAHNVKCLEYVQFMLIVMIQPPLKLKNQILLVLNAIFVIPLTVNSVLKKTFANNAQEIKPQLLMV